MADAIVQRMHAHASPELTEAVTVTRFWASVQKSGNDECWDWTGDVDQNGYGIFFYHEKKRPAHELALSFSTGEQRLERLDTCHSCDKPACCNPAHLRFDTRQSNVDDMILRGRQGRQGKLTDQDVITIRERRNAGARQKDLAEQFGVTDGTVSMIVRGIRWPNVGGPIESDRAQYRKKVA